MSISRLPPVPTVSAITFDFWDTLMLARFEGLRDKRIDALLGLIEGEGFAAERSAVGVALDDAFAVFQKAWHEGRQFHAHDAVDHMLGELGLEVPSDLRDALVAEVVGGVTSLEMTPNAASALRTLKAGGLKLGIICDVGWTPSTMLRGHLETHGVLSLFDHWSFSDEVGVYKPDARIFAHAMEGLGMTDPAQCAHIGDLRRTDVRGAQGAGWVSLRYAGAFDDVSEGPEADHVIRDHADLPAALGL